MSELNIDFPDISREVWDQNYRAPGENTVEDTWRRQALACAAVEKEEIREQIYNDFMWLLSDFNGCGGGRITANLGVPGRESTTLFNCYVMSPRDLNVQDIDSMEGIYDQLKKQALTLKSEGGYGMNFSWLRPAGSYVSGIGSRTPGVLKFMELWDKSSEIITMGSDKVLGKANPSEKKKIRKGAQMGILEIWHPEIEDFIDAKLTPNRLTKFNLSVGVTEGFMDACISNGDWDLKYPDTTFENYHEWDGDIKKWEDKGYPVIIHKTVKATAIWEKIMMSTFTRNDPGVLFLDICNKMNPLSYCENIATTNPCLTGDALVAVADGNGDKTIKELADIGKDVPVYCEDDNGKVVIRTMRHPRITGYEDVYEVTLENGHTIKATANHKFKTTEGEYKQVDELKVGDRLCVMDSDQFQDAGIIKPNTNQTYFRTPPQDTLSIYKYAIDQGYDAYLFGHTVHVNKICEICGSTFSVAFNRREEALCGDECNEVYKTKERKINLEEAATFNHRIISIVKLGKETVYNGTVDDFHNFFVGGFKETSKFNKPKSLYINNLQCGEISMSTGVCDLFSLNLVRYVKINGDKAEFDFDMFKKAIAIAVRFADNINDISTTPVPEYDASLKEKRRIGVGVLSLGSMLYVMGLRYGSDKANELTDLIFKTKMETELLTSARIGKEKGSFTLFDKTKYFNTYWWNNLPIDPSVKREIEEIGEMRNSHRSANAPTGNMSIYAGVTSGGVEPLFNYEYTRWSIVPECDLSVLRNNGFIFPDVHKGEWFETDTMKFVKKGSDDVLTGKFNSVSYMIDKNRGLVKASLVEDYGWRIVKVLGWQDKKDVYVTADELTVDEHINPLRIIAKYVDQNSSKTVNIPADYPYDSFKNIYMDAWKAGIKGITTYRAGTMAAVLEKNEDTKAKQEKLESAFNQQDGIIAEDVVLPDQAYSKLYTIRDNNKKKWYVNMVFTDESMVRPFAVFVNTNAKESVEVTDETITSLFKLATEKGLRNDLIADQQEKLAGQSNVTKIARSIGFLLRHNVAIIDIVNILDDGKYPLSSFTFHIKRLLKQFIKDGTVVEGERGACPKCGERLIFQEGCVMCPSCFFSKCS